MSYTSLMIVREILSFREFFMLTRFDIMFQSLAERFLWFWFGLHILDISLVWAWPEAIRRGEVR